MEFYVNQDRSVLREREIEEFNTRLRNARLYASFKPGQVIADSFLDRSGKAPQLVVIPTGSFTMGSPAGEEGHRPSEEPQRDVKITAGFALSRDDVTVAEFRAFVDDGNYATDADKLGGSSVYDEDSGRMIERRIGLRHHVGRALAADAFDARARIEQLVRSGADRRGVSQDVVGAGKVVLRRGRQRAIDITAFDLRQTLIDEFVARVELHHLAIHVERAAAFGFVRVTVLEKIRRASQQW